MTASGGRSPWTWALLALTAVVSAVPAWTAGRSLLRVAGVDAVTDQEAIDSGVGAFGFFGAEGLRVIEGLSLVVMLPIAVACLCVLVGLWRWRPWAREGALGVFGISGAVLAVFALSAVQQDTGDGRPLFALSLVATTLAVAGLALSPGVRDDFERREVERQARERAAATAARKARQAAGG